MRLFRRKGNDEPEKKDGPQGDTPDDGAAAKKPVWNVEGEKSMDSMLEEPYPSDPSSPEGGKIIFTDEQGRRRRLPAERGVLSSGELSAAADALHRDLGSPARDYARMAAVERLTELRAAGKMSEEDFLREKKRLENYG
jgi:hypothetical protein